MKHYNYHRTHEESNYSAAEDLRMRIKACTDEAEKEALEEDLFFAEEDDYKELLKRIMK